MLEKVVRIGETHCMVDIETLGVNPGCSIISIAAVIFNPLTGEVTHEFSRNVSLQSNELAGLKIEADTLEWWLTQKAEVLKENLSGSESIYPVLGQFMKWLQDKNVTHMWSNSPRFDLVILQEAFLKVLSIKAPWRYNKELDVRTFRWLDPKLYQEMVDTSNTQHNPLVDCHIQVKFVSAILNKIYRNE